MLEAKQQDDSIENLTFELQNLMAIHQDLIQELRNIGLSEEEIEIIRSGQFPDAG